MRESLKLTLVTPPAALPLTLDEARQHLRLDDADSFDEALIAALTRTVMQAAERYTGRALMTQVWDLHLDRWPASQATEALWEGIRIGADRPPRARAVTLPRPPLQGVVHVKTYDEADAATLWPAADYFVDTASTPGRLAARAGRELPLPGRAANGIEIRFTAGYGAAPADVPAPLRQGMLRLLAELYEHRGEDADSAFRNAGAERLWRPYRQVGL